MQTPCAFSGAMKLARGWGFLVLLLLLGGFPLLTGAEIASVSILGRQYIRVADWAQKAGLQMRWVKQDEMLEAGNSRVKIRLRINSGESDVNGVNVRLLFPIAVHNGAPCLTQLDADTTFRPIVFPPVNRQS